MYRHLIKGLSAGFRCVAPDHIGFGLSDKPFDVSYLPQFHAENLERFIDRRGVKDITLVIHDWRGAIGYSGSSQRQLSAKATGLHRYGLNGIASRVSLCRFYGGLKDTAFKMRELDRWKTAFPNLEAQTFSNVGHFVAEELGPDAIGPVQAFLRTHP
jgi:hypothetical protein